MARHDLEKRALITLVESLDKEIDRMESKNERDFNNTSMLIEHILNSQGMEVLYNLAKEIDKKNGNEHFQDLVAMFAPF